MQVLQLEQRSPEWYEVRRGRITMSNAAALLAKGKGVTRANYLREVAAEILGGDVCEDRYQSIDMLRGAELEPFAFDALREKTAINFEQVGFVIASDQRIGCSPDGLFAGIGCELKCPQVKHHLRYLDKVQIERDYGAQIQGSMWVSDCTQWVFASFCPDLKEQPLIVHYFARNVDIIADLSDSALRGADEVEQIVNSCRSAQTEPKIHAIAENARAFWAQYQMAFNDEVRL